METSSSSMSPHRGLPRSLLRFGLHKSGPPESPEVYASQVGLLYADAYIGLIASYVNAVLLTYIQWAHVSKGGAIAWLSIMTVLLFARICLVFFYHRREIGPENARTWGFWYGLGACATGLCWGCAGVLFVPWTSVPHQFFTTFVLAGVAAAAMTVLSPVYVAYVGYLVPTLTPVALLFLTRGDVLHVTAASLIVLYFLFLLKAGKTQNQLVRTSLHLALEKSELIDHLARQNQNVEALNESLRHEIIERRETEKALQFRLEFESLLTSISTRFINLPTDKIDRGIVAALGQLTEFSGTECAVLVLFSDDRASIATVLEWNGPKTRSVRERLEGLSLSPLTWSMEQLENLETIYIRAIEDLPGAAASEKNLLQSLGIRSFAAVPLATGALPLGFLGFHSGIGPISWNRETLMLFRMVAEMFLNALQRKKAQSDLEKAHRAAEAAAKAKAHFLANMSHEIRTPIHGILGMLALLKRSAPKSTERQYIQTAHRSAEILLGIIDDMLDFSRIEAGRLKLDAVEMDVREVVEEAAFLLAERAENKGLLLNCLVHNDVPQRVLADPMRLRQVLVNLVSNGVKFTDSGYVEVRVSEEHASTTEATLLFQVCDSGIGISAEALTDLFDPFTQGDGSSTRRHGGTGLGLAITSQLIDLMGGRIEVQSELGQGSTFSFRLDLPLVSAPSAAFSQVLRGLSLLLVEDNVLLRTSLVHYLDGWKIQYSSTGSAEQAIQLIQKASAAGTPYEVVIIGRQLIGMRPLECARALLGDTASTPHPPVLLLSPVSEVHLYEDMPQELALLTWPVRHGALFNALVERCGDVVGPRDNRDLLRDGAESLQGGDDAYSFRGKRILLVEDNVVNQQVAFEMLSVIGTSVKIAADGEEALRLFQSEPFDLVFMDCQMPVMDGLQATRLIREYERRSTDHVTPIIALTASALIGDREKCITSGMNDYLPKPFRMVDLKAMLMRWLA
ncbi:MAG: response regulator [Syntrophobacteraceae bacterium]